MEITDNEPVFARESDESDEDLKKLTSSMSMFARDINKYKETKGVDKYRPPRRPEAPYRPTERYPDSYQKEQYDNDRYRPNDRPDNRYRQPDRRYEDYYRQTEPFQRAKVQGVTINHDKITAKEDTAVKVKRDEKNTAREDTATIISKEEMRETKGTVRRNGTRRMDKKMIAQRCSDMKRRRREKTESLLALSVGLPGTMQENARAS